VHRWLNYAICQQYQTLGSYSGRAMVIADNYLSFDLRVSDVVRSCNYHIRSLRHIRPLIDRETAVNCNYHIQALRRIGHLLSRDVANTVLQYCRLTA